MCIYSLVLTYRLAEKLLKKKKENLNLYNTRDHSPPLSYVTYLVRDINNIIIHYYTHNALAVWRRRSSRSRTALRPRRSSRFTLFCTRRRVCKRRIYIIMLLLSPSDIVTTTVCAPYSGSSQETFQNHELSLLSVDVARIVLYEHVVSERGSKGSACTTISSI